MSEIIQVLQQIGQSARLQSSKVELNAYIQATGIPEEIKSAILAGAHSTLNVLLGGNTTVICGLLTPDEDEGEGKTPPNDDEIKLAA